MYSIYSQMPVLVPEQSIPFHGDYSVIPNRSCAVVVQAQNGVFAFGRLMLGDQVFLEVCERIREYPPPWLHDLQPFEKKTHLFAGKARKEKIETVTSFFRWTYEEHRGSEAIVFIYFSPLDGGTWEFIPPPQEVTPGNVHWKDPGATPNGWVLMGSIHSHGSGSAYHSATDDRDELHDWNGIHATFGRLGRSRIQLDISTSVVINGSRFFIELDEIVEDGSSRGFPEEWKNEVRRAER